MIFFNTKNIGDFLNNRFFIARKDSNFNLIFSKILD